MLKTQHSFLVNNKCLINDSENAKNEKFPFQNK